MPFSVMFSNKPGADKPVLNIKVIPAAEGQQISAGDQAVLQDYLKSGSFRAGGKTTPVSSGIIGEPVNDEKGKPLEVQLQASVGVVDAMVTRMIISNTRAQELKKRLGEVKAAGAGERGRS